MPRRWCHGAVAAADAHCDFDWTGADSDRWDEPDNWDGPADEVPGAPTDVVCIDQDVNLPVVYDAGLGTDTTIAELANSAAIDAIGLRIVSGSLTLLQASDLPHLGIQLGDDGAFGEPTLLVEDRLDVGSPSAWPRGTLGGDGTTTFDADLIGGPDPRTRVLDAHELVLNGTTELQTPDLFLENGSTLTNTGTLVFDGGSWLRTPAPLSNLLRNEGTVVKRGTGTGLVQVELDNAAGGTVRAEGGTLQLTGEGTNDGAFVVDADATIEFAGSIIGRRYVHTVGSTVSGAGTIASTHTSGFEVAGAYDVGTTSLVAPSVFRLSYAKFHHDDATTGELIVQLSRPRGPGTLTVTGDVTYLSQDTREALTIDAAGDLLLSSDRFKWIEDGSLLRVAGAATHDEGDVRIRESEVDVTGPYTHTGDDLELDAGVLRTSRLDIGADAQLSGLGEVDGDVVNAGIIDPGLSPFRGGPGPLSVLGDLTLTSDGEVRIDLEGRAPGEFDRIDASGQVTVDGTLTVTLDDAIVPVVGDEFPVVTGDRTGTFATVDLPPLDGDARFELDHQARAVVLRVVGDETPQPDPEPEPEPDPEPQPEPEPQPDPDPEPQPEPEVAPACPSDVPAAGFTDVPDGNVHADAIDCIAWYGITVGVSASTYVPSGTVTRGQKASFVARMLTVAGVDLPEVDTDAFDDIGGSTHARAINQLQALGIVEGDGAGTFRPRSAVSRGQSASMIVRSLALVLDQPLPAPAGRFTDTDGNVHAGAIDAAAAAGITRGTTPTTFDPGGDTRRDQMASLLARTLEVLAADGRVAHP